MNDTPPAETPTCHCEIGDHCDVCEPELHAALSSVVSDAPAGTKPEPQCNCPEKVWAEDGSGMNDSTCEVDHDAEPAAPVSPPPNLDKRPPRPDDWKWYSICSSCPEYRPECGRCNAGRWISPQQEELKQWLYRRNYKLWLEWVNRAESEDRKFLEETFPNLAGGGK